VGIITGGIAYQYAKEVLPGASYLKLGMSYPLPRRKIQEFAASVDRVVVIEDLDPFWEEQVRLMGIECLGKLDGELFPLWGEFSPDVVRAGLAKAGFVAPAAALPDVTAQLPLPPRPPVLCPGCPHRGVFHVFKKLKLVVFGDIGCYALGAVPPLSIIDTCGCMGAGIGQLHGAEKAGLADKAVAVIGDSTFFHTGMPALLNVAYNRGAELVVIMDNRTTAMTGHQEHPGTGRTLQRQETVAIDVADMARAMGIRHVAVVDPYDLKATETAIREGLNAGEPAVVVTLAPCALRVPRKPALVIDPERCNGCGLCLRVGCLALYRVSEDEARIDPLLCTGCTVCQQVCARKAIEVVAE
jgi:indolepyruvate ferredoxin oxidoreductase alpha subunit